MPRPPLLHPRGLSADLTKGPVGTVVSTGLSDDKVRPGLSPEQTSLPAWEILSLRGWIEVAALTHMFALLDLASVENAALTKSLGPQVHPTNRPTPCPVAGPWPLTVQPPPATPHATVIFPPQKPVPVTFLLTRSSGWPLLSWLRDAVGGTVPGMAAEATTWVKILSSGASGAADLTLNLSKLRVRPDPPGMSSGFPGLSGRHIGQVTCPLWGCPVPCGVVGSTRGHTCDMPDMPVASASPHQP